MDAYSWGVALLGYRSKIWKRARRLFHEFFSTKAVTKFDDYQRKYAHRFISRLDEAPDDFLDHCKLCVPLRMGSSYAKLTLILPSVISALVMEITYGFDIKSHDDEFLQAAKRAMEYAERAMTPGTFLVDTFPIRAFSP